MTRDEIKRPFAEVCGDEIDTLRAERDALAAENATLRATHEEITKACERDALAYPHPHRDDQRAQYWWDAGREWMKQGVNTILAARGSAPSSDPKPEFDPNERVTMTPAQVPVYRPIVTPVKAEPRIVDEWGDPVQPVSEKSPVCGSQGVDSDGHCLRCGLFVDRDIDADEVDCPPGFLVAAPRVEE